MTTPTPDLQGWIDVSVPLRTGLVHWPGDPEPTFEPISEIEQGSEANVTMCRMTAHTGTHIDAPRHFIEGAAGIDAFPLDVGIGPARIVTVPITSDTVGPAELECADIQPGERILLRTRNSDIEWYELDFYSGFVGLSVAGAEYMAGRGVSLVGVDYLSVGLFNADGAKTHRTLLSAGIWIVEGLVLSGLDAGEYDMVCLPLRIAGSDGSPARAALRSRNKKAANA